MLLSTGQHLALILYVSGANATVNSTVKHLVLILFISCANAIVNSTTLSINTVCIWCMVNLFSVVKVGGGGREGGRKGKEKREGRGRY